MGDQTICFLNSSQTWGGGEKWHFEIARRMHQDGISVRLLVAKDGALHERVCAEGLSHDLIDISKASILNPFTIRALSQRLKDANAAAIFLNMSSDLKAGAPAAYLAGIPNIIYRRGTAKRIRNTFYNRFLFKRFVTGVLANSQETKRTITEKAPGLFPLDKIKVIYNGIDPSRYDLSDAKRPHQGSKPLIIGNLGRLVRQKGHVLLMDVAARLKEMDLQFIMRIGGDGPLRKKIEDRAHALGVADRIEFSGYVSDVCGFMRDIDIFVLPSLWEGFGYVLTEAMASAKPVVAFNHTSNPEVVLSGDTGVLVPPMDVNLFAEAVHRLANDKTLRDRMGEAGRKRVLENFTFERCYRELLSWLAEMNCDCLPIR